MRGGYRLFQQFPQIENNPAVKRALIQREICKYCTVFPLEAKSFDCAFRGKTVYKTTGIRLYCFDPITDAELEKRLAFEHRRMLDRNVRWYHSMSLEERQAFLDRHRERRLKWQEKNKDKLGKKKQLYRLANLERERQRSRDWYLANTERHRAIAKAWRESNPERAREIARLSQARYRERKRNAQQEQRQTLAQPAQSPQKAAPTETQPSV
jgi:hypothetical protein